MREKKVLIIFVGVVTLLVLYGLSKVNTGKATPIKLIVGFENSEGYKLQDDIEFELSQDVPEAFYKEENVDGNLIFSFTKMNSSAITFHVTISDEKGIETHSGGFVGDGAVEVQLKPNASCELKYELGVKENKETGLEEVVDFSTGHIEIYAKR